MGTNEYGLDVDYLKKRMGRMVRDLDRYTPDEAFNDLLSMAQVAASQSKDRINVKVDITTPNK